VFFLTTPSFRYEHSRFILLFKKREISSQLKKNKKKREKEKQPLIDCPVENYLYEKSCLSIIFWDDLCFENTM
jgi:hypothetical protein